LNLPIVFSLKGILVILRFWGIDHTAIAVSNTQTSLQFYQVLLGLRLAGESENYGTEQEHLNNVFGARLHISGLRYGRATLAKQRLYCYFFRRDPIS
jgi:catechol 2,3-dioxygenase-like lactoylglutathione lyase family enzyme